MAEYTVIIEKSETNFGAWVPDLEGCVSVGATPEEVEQNIREAIELHLQGMREDGEAIPAPSVRAVLVSVAA